MFENEEMVATVSQLNSYIKTVLSNDENLRFLMVRGEISNFKVGGSGHAYFSLKDEKSKISAVMFKEAFRKLSFLPNDGDEVIIVASLDVYEANGSYQLYVRSMEKRGLGAQLVELEELKKKLASEGLFSKNKRPINQYPKAIGIITAINSAAIKDMITNIKRRYPIADILIFPSSVQGEKAPEELIRAFEKSQEYDLDTLIIGRGGGASEDLSAFNDEALVRKVATSKIPVIAAVGHEIDFTLLDFVADVRVSTPTGAAEKATVDRRDIEQGFDHKLEMMQNAITSSLGRIKSDVSSLDERLNQSIRVRIKHIKAVLEGRDNELTALNPKDILTRGYSISLGKDGKPIKSVNKANKGDSITTLLADGKIISEVKETKYDR